MPRELPGHGGWSRVPAMSSCMSSRCGPARWLATDVQVRDGISKASHRRLPGAPRGDPGQIGEQLLVDAEQEDYAERQDEGAADAVDEG